MSRKLAVKRLSHSDLSLFKRYLDVYGASKQKGINLNKKVLIGTFYPSMPYNGKFGVQLAINGPGPTIQPHELMRKIIKSPGSKNWRLNGEFVEDPLTGDKTRYGLLLPNDLVLLEFFDGETALPARIRMVLLSKKALTDVDLHKALDTLLPPVPAKGAMAVLTQEKLIQLVSHLVPAGHPMQDFLTEEADLELLANGGDVELGEPEPETAPAPPATGSPAVTRSVRVYKPRDFNKTAKPSLSRVSAETLAKSKATASENGEAGEELVCAYLDDEAGITGYEWTSRLNAIAPYDFKLDISGEEEMIDVKTTAGPFEAPFHISINELKQAACAPGAYRIYRVYDVKGSPKLRISGNIRDFAASLLAHVQALPAGVIADGFTLKPSLPSLAMELDFGKEIELGTDEEDF